MKHFKFPIRDAKNLAIAFIGAFGGWAARGFAHDFMSLWYAFGGFFIGGLTSHETSASPNVSADSHIQTPYSNNLTATTDTTSTGTNVQQVIKINSGIIK